MNRKTMRAVMMREFGGPERLRLEEVPAPEPSGLREREVLIRVRAVGVCYHDIINRSGNLPRTRLPTILGHEIAGEIVAIGPAVQDFRPGDRVATVQRVHCGRCDLCRRGRTTLCKEGVFFGEEIPGGYAEYVVSEEQGLARIPHGIPFEEGSICACTIGTALHVARTRGGVQLDETVLITGASGGVGLHAIQDRPVAREGNVVIRPMMYVALTYDHRIVDGREAGHVTSGSPSITLKKNIGLAYLPADRAAIGTTFQVQVRNKLSEAKIVRTPFYKRIGGA